MFLTEILFAAAGAFLITMLFAAIFRPRGAWPWPSLLMFFAVVLLAGWAAQLWIDPFGPTLLEVAWVPMLFVGLLVGLIWAALPPVAPVGYESAGAVAIEIFIWLAFVALLIAVIVPYL